VTATVPIVVTTGADPFVGGLVKSLARPGGNVTGFTTMSAETSGKVFEVFREVVPGLKRVAVGRRMSAIGGNPEKHLLAVSFS